MHRDLPERTSTRFTRYSSPRGVLLCTWTMSDPTTTSSVQAQARGNDPAVSCCGCWPRAARSWWLCWLRVVGDVDPGSPRARLRERSPAPIRGWMPPCRYEREGLGGRRLFKGGRIPPDHHTPAGSRARKRACPWRRKAKGGLSPSQLRRIPLPRTRVNKGRETLLNRRLCPPEAAHGTAQMRSSPMMRTILIRHRSDHVGLTEALHLTAVGLVVC